MGITRLVRLSLILSVYRSPFSGFWIPCHLASFALLIDILRYSGSGSITPLQTPALLTSMITPSFLVIMTRTTRPLAPLRTSAGEGVPSSWIRHHFFIVAANKTLIERSSDWFAQLVVLFHRSSELNNLFVDGLSTAHSVLGDGPS